MALNKALDSILSGEITGATITIADMPLDKVHGLIQELSALKAENEKLKEWIKMGAYSAK